MNRVWRIVSDGTRVEVPDGAEFLCLTNSPITVFDDFILNPINYLVWDRVPLTVITGLYPNATRRSEYPDKAPTAPPASDVTGSSRLRGDCPLSRQ